MAQPIYDDFGPLEQYLRSMCWLSFPYLSSLPAYSLCPVSGDLDMMPGSLAEFALEHEFDDHHYLKNSWMRDIVTSIVRVSLLSHSPLRR